ncbi:sugar ABC transporter permease [Paenibacillus swuensis]|uniref:Sugar ABC transporter permease n=2 Tax=Paenibacillus swuensis TaxID=1178515 RepID=A0A172TDQ6_9BACL|nr:sugar ABC transporter permease [Paenibacillus swuensis]
MRMHGKLKQSEMWYGYLFILPMVIGYGIFLLGPIITSFMMSFTDWSLIKEAKFIGLDNYKRMFTADPLFYDTALNTLYFTLILVPVNIVLTLGLAMLLQEKIPGIGFFRTAIFTPVVTSVVVWAIVWKYIFQTDNGLLNTIIKMLGFEGQAWLYNLSLAIPVVVTVTLLKGLGMNMVIFLAALNDVPQMYYEAAKIDGASKWRTFRSVTLPMISPAIFMVLIITIIGSLKVFGQIYVMTGGGPGTSTYVFVYYIYEQAFKMYEFGYASSIAFVLFFIIMVLTIIQWVGRKRWVHHEE